ncbi:hypothetical protein Tco_1554025 [Tanacetum coccineum]
MFQMLNLSGMQSNQESLDKAYDRFPKTQKSIGGFIGASHYQSNISTRSSKKSFSSSWNQIALIMRNKPGIDEIDIDGLYNNLRVYEDEMKSTASGDIGLCTAGGTSQVPSTPCAHDVAYSFFGQPTTSPQLENRKLSR